MALREIQLVAVLQAAKNGAPGFAVEEVEAVYQRHLAQQRQAVEQMVGPYSARQQQVQQHKAQRQQQQKQVQLQGAGQPHGAGQAQHAHQVPVQGQAALSAGAPMHQQLQQANGQHGGNVTGQYAGSPAGSAAAASPRTQQLPQRPQPQANSASAAAQAPAPGSTHSQDSNGRLAAPPQNGSADSASAAAMRKHVELQAGMHQQQQQQQQQQHVHNGSVPRRCMPEPVWPAAPPPATQGQHPHSLAEQSSAHLAQQLAGLQVRSAHAPAQSQPQPQPQRQVSSDDLQRRGSQGSQGSQGPPSADTTIARAPSSRRGGPAAPSPMQPRPDAARAPGGAWQGTGASGAVTQVHSMLTDTEPQQQWPAIGKPQIEHLRGHVSVHAPGSDKAARQGSGQLSSAKRASDGAVAGGVADGGTLRDWTPLERKRTSATPSAPPGLAAAPSASAPVTAAAAPAEAPPAAQPSQAGERSAATDSYRSGLAARLQATTPRGAAQSSGHGGAAAVMSSLMAGNPAAQAGAIGASDLAPRAHGGGEATGAAAGSMSHQSGSSWGSGAMDGVRDAHSRKSTLTLSPAAKAFSASEPGGLPAGASAPSAGAAEVVRGTGTPQHAAAASGSAAKAEQAYREQEASLAAKAASKAAAEAAAAAAANSMADDDEFPTLGTAAAAPPSRKAASKPATTASAGDGGGGGSGGEARAAEAGGAGRAGSEAPGRGGADGDTLPPDVAAEVLIEQGINVDLLSRAGSRNPRLGKTKRKEIQEREDMEMARARSLGLPLGGTKAFERMRKRVWELQGRLFGGGKCRACGEHGHIAKQCSHAEAHEAAPSPAPSPQRPRLEDLPCPNCQKTGHLRRDCPEPEKSDRCFNCGQHDHRAAGCPNEWRSSRTSGGGGAAAAGAAGWPDDRACNVCGKLGHIGATCPKAECRNCGRKGHMSSRCPDNPDNSAVASYSDPRLKSPCPKCHRMGHLGADCPNVRPIDMPCPRCGETGHIVAHCPRSDLPRDAAITGRKCGRKGHRLENCPGKKAAR
jgi:Zinc knuckle